MLQNITRMRATVAAATVFAAAASGYFLQSGNSTSSVQASLTPVPVSTPAAPEASAPSEPLPELTTAETDTAPALTAPQIPSAPVVTRAAAQPVLAIPAIPAAPQAPEDESLVLAAIGDGAPDISRPEDPGQPLPQLACETGFTAFAAPGAMVDLTLEAPCRAGEAADIFHAGLRFTLRLDATGLARVSVPALEEDALFSVLFTDGASTSAEVLMLTVSDYERTVLGWKGEAGFDLYALENGAEWGSAGHVGIANPYTPQRATAGEGGFLTTLGSIDKGYHAMIYSWPERLGDTGPAPEISIEAGVSMENCAHKIAGTLLQSDGTGAPDSLPIMMMVPGCDAVGEYLVLKNLPRDLKLAAK